MKRVFCFIFILDKCVRYFFILYKTALKIKAGLVRLIRYTFKKKASQYSEKYLKYILLIRNL